MLPIYNPKDLSELFFTKVAQTNPDQFFEVGCFEAEFSRDLVRRLGYRDIIAFEANPHNYLKHNKQIENSGVKHIHAAITDHDGRTKFYLQNENAYRPGNNSIFKREDDPEFGYTSIEVDCYRLDTHLKESTNTVCMWIDAEGAAYNVLLGATETLKKTKYVFIEVEEKVYWKDQKTVIEVTKLLNDRGFLEIARDNLYPDQYNIIFEK
tara:strand:+ start:157 stop:783 length:627 start_codon:yes stop_codon:yes gene_type:complete